MNKAITEGLVLMPPAFAAGLNLWSREDGRPGQGSWQGQGNAAFVPADQDFAGCLEILKQQTVTKLRCFQQIPMQPGMYLRVTARVKALAGALPSVRIAAWAGKSNGNASSVPGFGPEVALESYGSVVEVSAIIGSGARHGVDMVWGTDPVYGHFGLDLTGANGGTVRIDDIRIEDVTSVFHRDMMDWVDVRDYGAIGDGVTDDAAAFLAADAAAGGRKVLVSGGSYYIGRNITLNARVKFEGTLVMPADARLACTRNFDLDTYAAAFGGELAGFKRALHALFYFTDHVTLDLSGRRVDIPDPIDVAAVGRLTTFEQRRVLTNGQLNAVSGSGWDSRTVTSVATYTTSDPNRLTGVANVANIEVGSLVAGTGVGREIYVRAKNVADGTLDLSAPPGATGGTRTFTFTRFRYVMDFSGFTKNSKFEMTDIEIQCNGVASAVMLPPAGTIFRMADCVVNKPKDRGITSIGTGCQGLLVDQCQFLSNEQEKRVQERTTIAVNVNSNDAKLRDNRVVRFAHFAILDGSGHMIIGNHFFQGDNESAGVRRAGIVFTQTNLRTVVTGNYVDNCFIEMSNEHDPNPEFNNEFSFGGLTISANTFMISSSAPYARCIVITPRGPGHFVNGLSVTGNTFRTVNTTIDRVEAIDTTYASMDFSRFRNCVFEANTFHGITEATVSPVTVEHAQTTAAGTWTIDGSSFMPFGAWSRNVRAVVAEGPITSASGAVMVPVPYVEVEKGSAKNRVELHWPQAAKGRVHVTLRCDNPN
ncbi:glycosyl hydrolase family 28-related protein [Falsirhodobacter xinxiangensis]|uniref:glycosyl hydrolase family 28-related protein n=1 Tax=Falsirhodobacter xinxiangensis TaxID=2530049 RepID=UPI0010AB1D63|nr:glycosyl hydrolase family 28-related protein [Rhodobacter xinxiangensis]